jgi:bifunctional oligoribonuclease and PAP phosphatase NrnA
MIERPDAVKLSFRSRGEFSANEFARKYFEGGGHKNAAGGKSNLNLAETENKFLEILKHTSIA